MMHTFWVTAVATAGVMVGFWLIFFPMMFTLVRLGRKARPDPVHTHDIRLWRDNSLGLGDDESGWRCASCGEWGIGIPPYEDSINNPINFN